MKKIELAKSFTGELTNYPSGAQNPNAAVIKTTKWDKIISSEKSNADKLAFAKKTSTR